MVYFSIIVVYNFIMFLDNWKVTLLKYYFRVTLLSTGELKLENIVPAAYPGVLDPMTYTGNSNGNSTDGRKNLYT
jgi:hypothetical protein